MKKMMGRVGLLAVAIVWGSGFVASAMALEHFTPYQILSLRFTLAFIGSLSIYGRNLKNMKFKDLKKGGVLGVFLFLAFLFQTVGLQYTTASKNAFLTAVNIVIVPFLSWIILKNKTPKKVYIGALITLVGIGFLSTDGSGLGLMGLNQGDILTLICAVFFALQIFYTDFYVKDTEPGVIMIAQMGVASLLSWTTILFSAQTNFDINAESILPIIYLGLVSTLVAYGLQTWAQKSVESAQAAVILATEAFFGMAASIIILNENITKNMMIGALLIFIGIIIVEVKPEKIKRNEVLDG